MTNFTVHSLLEKLNNYADQLFEVFYYLENLREFSEVEASLRQYFYHSFLKCKRNYKAVLTLVNLQDEDLKNPYVEAIPLLRTLVECYFHLSYLTTTNKNEVLQMYDKLSKFQIKQMLSNKQGYQIALHGQADEELLTSLLKELEKVKKKDISLFYNMELLAQKTKNENIYYGIYKKFNSYVHFNPTTYISYGEMSGHDNFNYGRMLPQPERECEIIYFSIEVAMKVLITTMHFIKIEFLDQSIQSLITDWSALRDEFKNTNLVNYVK